MQTSISSSDLKNYVDLIVSLRKSFDLISDHVVITDSDGHILYANKAAQEHTGYHFEEMGGANPGKLWGGHMDREFYEHMWHTIKIEKKPFVGEVKNHRKDGTEHWQELHISPVLDEGGNIRYFIGIEPDITGKKTKEQLRQEFLLAVGQQLHQPLAAIQWVIELLEMKGRLDDEDKARLREIYHQHKDLVGFIMDFINATKSN